MRISPFIAKDWSSKVAKCHVWPKERWEMSNISQTSSCPVEFGCPKKSLLGPKSIQIQVLALSKNETNPSSKPHVHIFIGIRSHSWTNQSIIFSCISPWYPNIPNAFVKSAVRPPDLDSSAESTKTTFFGTNSCHDLPKGKWVGLKSASKRKLVL